MAKESRFIDCRNLTFSRPLGQDRILRAQRSLGETVVHRILCFSLYLLGVNRRAIGQALSIPAETAKSIIKAVGTNGLPALEDRRHRISTFLPQSPPRIAPVRVYVVEEHIVVGFGVEGRRLEIPRQNVLQVRTILLSMLNSGLLTQAASCRCNRSDARAYSHTGQSPRRRRPLLANRQAPRAEMRLPHHTGSQGRACAAICRGHHCPRQDIRGCNFFRTAQPL